MDFYDQITSLIVSGKIKDKDQLQKEKLLLSKKFNLDVVPSDVEILNYADNRRFVQLLRKKPTRTVSGVAVVAAMTSPEACPHGKCIFCPGGIDSNSPQSYTGYEPSALRGRTNYYDSYNIAFSRLKQLETIGHDTSKVDLIVMPTQRLCENSFSSIAWSSVGDIFLFIPSMHPLTNSSWYSLDLAVNVPPMTIKSTLLVSWPIVSSCFSLLNAIL